MSLLRPAFVALALALGLATNASAVRIMTNPAPDLNNDPILEFFSINVTPDGSTLVATTNLTDPSGVDGRTVTLPVPANPLVDTVALTQITTTNFFAGAYDVDFQSVVSPDGQTVLVTHNGLNPGALAEAPNTIFTVPIGGEGAGTFTGLFDNTTNVVSPGTSNRQPVYSPDGSTIFFINGNAGFQGSPIPDFEAGDDPPRSFADLPEWDQLYSVPAAGGTPVAITTPGDGDIDNNLFSVTPNGASVVYSPGSPITLPTDRGSSSGMLFSVPAAGGTSTEIPIAPSSNPLFAITERLEVTPDGQSVLFIGDYETYGKFELFSVPIAGGTPTRISDDLPFAGDVDGFEISPDGTSVGYIAGQNTSANNELFFKALNGAPGSSIRISDAPVANDGTHDVTQIAKGAFVFAPDGSEVYLVGDLNTDATSDLYVVDLTEKGGIIPSAFTYVGPADGEFFDEANWQDADGNPAPADTINPDTGIQHSLIIDGDSVTTALTGQLDIAFGGSLELTAGSSLTLTQAGQQLDINPGAGLKVTDANITVDDDLFLEGTMIFEGGTVQSLADDIQFEDGHQTTIDGTTFISGDNTFFDNSAVFISNATFAPADRFGLSYTSEVTVTDTTINIQDGAGDVDEVFDNENGDGSTLILKGASELFATSMDDGIDLVIDDMSVATFSGSVADLAGLSTITVLSTDAEIVITSDREPTDGFDLRDFIIDGTTGLSYTDDPSAWNVSNWDGLGSLASLKLASVALLMGDANGDGTVDLLDLDILGANFGLTEGGTVATGDFNGDGAVDLLDLDILGANFGESINAVSVPEPATALLAVFGLVSMLPRRKR